MKRKWLVIAISAMMALGAAATSYAAGWKMEDGAWIYEDSSGAVVVNEWKRGADNLWRYLDGSGRMAVNSWVDGEYYVDENGIMVSNGWRQLEAESSYYNDRDDLRWYYFLESGKVVKDTWKKINDKWYHFGSDGAMDTGWTDENMYYCGEDGSALIGWHMLYPPEDENFYTSDPFDENDGKRWYYFNSSGKKYTAPEGKDYGERRIDGVYYCFDAYGAMQTGWVNLGSSGSSSIANYRYYTSSGKSVTGWYTALPPEEIAGSYVNEVEWFYFSSTGAPKVGPAEGEARLSDFTRINGKTYLFNDLGNPVFGLQKVDLGSEETCYYFDEVSRNPVSGKVQVEQRDGTKSTFHFETSGKGTSGVSGGYLYYMGLLQQASDGNKYEPITIPHHGTYVVNSSGRIVKSSSGAKAADGTRYSTDSNGKLIKVNGEAVDSDGVWRTATEPAWK